MKFKEFVFGTAFLMVLGSCCAGVFWFVIHSKDTEGVVRRIKFASLKGQQAPGFKVTTIDGVSVASTARNRPMVLEVYASWCEICSAEIPTLNRLKHAHPELDVIAITGDKKGSDLQPESLADVKKYRSRKHVDFQLAFDPSMVVAQDFKIVGYPSIFVIDRSGKILFNGMGAVDYADLDSAVRKSS